MTQPQGSESRAGEPRDVFIVGGTGSAWVRHLAGLLAGRGHQVRQIADSEPDGRLRGLLREARPGGVVIAVDAAGMRRTGAAGPAECKVIGLCTTTRQGMADARRREIVELFAGAPRFLALSGEDADAWARDGLTNADVIAGPLRPVPGPAPVGAVVCGPAELTHGSGADLLVEAWAQVAGRHPAWRLHLGAEGPEAGAVRRLASDLGVDASVRFGAAATAEAGNADEPPVESAVEPVGESPAEALADSPAGERGSPIVALSSRDESLPWPVQDAMAAGLPIVAFDSAPIIRDHLTDEVDGLLVSPGNTAQFAAALDRLMSDDGLRRKLGAAARESVRRFEPDVVLDRWERVFSLVHR